MNLFMSSLHTFYTSIFFREVRKDRVALDSQELKPLVQNSQDDETDKTQEGARTVRLNLKSMINSNPRGTGRQTGRE